MDSGKYKRNNHLNTIKFKNTKYLERLQKVMDSARTASQSLEVRKRFIDRQNNMNYRNEFDRLHGELLHLKSPELIKEAINNMMDVNELKAFGEYQEPSPTMGSKPPSPTIGSMAPSPIKTPGVKIAEAKAKGRPRKEPVRSPSPEPRQRGRPRKVIDATGRSKSVPRTV